MEKEIRFAVLIDADNIPYNVVKEIFEEIAKYGTPTFKRIYADWTKPTVSGWKTVLLENAITPVQQYSYTTGKNSTDSAMIIDAMDILYSGKVDGFCIISSDSDFTRLATRLREAGMKVIGIGAKKTPVALISACEKFIYLEILRPSRTRPQTITPATNALPGTAAKPLPRGRGRTPKPKVEKTEAPTDSINKIDREIVDLIEDSVNDLADESGWAFLGDLGNLIMKKKPDFDARNYGFSKMLPLFKSLPGFQVDVRETGRNNVKHVYIRKNTA